jgi:hypothetical protein
MLNVPLQSYIEPHANKKKISCLHKNVIITRETGTVVCPELHCHIAKIHAVNTGRDASKADSNMAKGLEARLLLTRGAHVMLRANL